MLNVVQKTETELDSIPKPYKLPKILKPGSTELAGVSRHRVLSAKGAACNGEAATRQAPERGA